MSKFTKSISFIGLTIAMFMGTLDSTIVNIALPKIMAHFHASLPDTSWVATIYTLALAVFMITASKIADRYGRKKIMLVGLALFGVFSTASVLTNSLAELIVFRFFQGLGGAIITPVVLPMAMEIFGKEKMSQVASVVGAVTALAAAGGPPIGGILIQYASWRWVFGINIPLTILSFVIIAIWTKESYDESLSGRIDLLGTCLLTLGLGGITFGLLEGREYGWSSPTIVASLIGGLLATLLFIYAEKKVANPLLELDLFKEKTLTASSLVYFLTGFALVSPMLILNYFLQNVLNYTALNAALIVIPVSLMIVIAMALGTKLFDRIGAVPVTFSGLIILAASLLLLSFIKTDTPKAIMIVFVLINGIGFGFASVSLVASVKHLPQNKSGIGSGIVNSARQIGTCLGIAILVTVLDANVNSAKTDIRRAADRNINQEVLSPQVKITAHQQLKKTFAASNSGRLSAHSTEASMRKALKQAAKSKKQLPAPKKGTDLNRIYRAEKRIQAAHQAIGKGSQQLTNNLSRAGRENALIAQIALAAGRLNQGNQKISQGQGQLLTGIKQLAQKERLKLVMHQIKKEKNQDLSQAFSHTYLLSAVIMLCLSPIAFWTDRQAD